MSDTTAADDHPDYDDLSIYCGKCGACRHCCPDAACLPRSDGHKWGIVPLVLD